jgi:hypothetical protein
MKQATSRSPLLLLLAFRRIISPPSSGYSISQATNQQETGRKQVSFAGFLLGLFYTEHRSDVSPKLRLCSIFIIPEDRTQAIITVLCSKEIVAKRKISQSRKSNLDRSPMPQVVLCVR